MIKVQYYLSDGQEIVFTAADNAFTIHDISDMAAQYAEKRRDRLPTHVYISARDYKEVMWNTSGGITWDPTYKRMVQCVLTAVGPLSVVIVPYGNDAKNILVGCPDDYQRYDIDKIFEDTVLADCEREK